MSARHVTGLCLGLVVGLWAASAPAATITKQGKNAAGQPCTASVEKHADGSITARGSSGSSAASAGSVSSSSSAGGSSVQVQAGNGSVSSSTTMPGGSGSTASAGVVTVDGCTISTTSP